jgi:hypothetical protein
MRAKKLLKTAGTLAGLSFLGSGLAHGQSPLTQGYQPPRSYFASPEVLMAVQGTTPPANAKPAPKTTTPAPATVVPAPSTVTPAPVTIVEAPPASGSGCCEPANPCAKFPSIYSMPRMGAFIIPEGKPGYYTLRDLIFGDYREKAPPQPYSTISLNPGSFFDNDFRYLDKPDNTVTDFFDPIKRVRIGDHWLLQTGGEFRYRYMNEVSSRLTGRNNSYHLTRSRAYVDIGYCDQFRIYGEFIEAHSFQESLPPLLVDRNAADILNLFADVKLLDVDKDPIYVRIGRQELLLGSQRLVSPLEWVNTRRNFDGVRIFRHSEKFDIDGFWTKPVIPNNAALDSWDDDANFSGGWLTYKPQKGTFLDLYVLNYNQARPVAVGRNGFRGGFDITTVGTRACGDFDGMWLYDTELAYQMGNRAGQAVSAGMATVGGGIRGKDIPWVPTFWAYWDYASGSANPGGPGSFGTFNQLFPFGHNYLGWADIVGRQNIHDFNYQISLQPTPWITFLTQYHIFRLDSSRDALFNTAGAPVRLDPTGAAGHDVGQEIDCLANIRLSRHQDILIGYSKLFAGPVITRTGNPLSPELFYAQYSFRW